MQPDVQLGYKTLEEVEDILNHIWEIFREELTRMASKRKGKTLDIGELEAVMKLCLPNALNSASTRFGKIAIEAILRNKKKRII